MWDAIVSNLRIYLPAQMQELAADLRAPDYYALPYLIGRPSP
jgi:hypothetical protein